jgi:hypothetical protein
MIRSLVAMVVAVALSGCMVGERSTAPDADADRLPDFIETGGWNLTIHKTFRACFSSESPDLEVEIRNVTSNELRTDTDGDGVSDFEEYFFQGDPRDTDTDDDGLDDGTEWELRSGTGLFANARLALNRADSDDDCLSDGEEIGGLEIPGLGLRTSDPTTDDSDHDGLTDAVEFRRTFTDPMDPDTDDDGAEDGLDLDPRNDVWMRIRLVSIAGKDLPSSQARVQFFWIVPTPPNIVGTSSGSPFLVQEGQSTTIPQSAMPGALDVDDRRGGTRLIFELYARIVDNAGNVIDVLDINPHRPGQAVSVRYDVALDTWEFGTGAGFTPSGRETVLETSQVRLIVDFEDFPAGSPPS